MGAVSFDVTTPEVPPTYRRLNRSGRIAVAALALVTLVALLAPVLAPHSTSAPVGSPLQGPSSTAWLGTDDLGRDLLSRILLGIRASWFSALVVVASGVAIGAVVGLTAALFGKWVDSVLMRITDAMLALPGPVLAIAVGVALGGGLVHTVIAVIVVWWPFYARIVRGEARALVVRPHFAAAKLAGAGRLSLAFRHVLPGMIPVLLVIATLDLGALILTLAGLSFLGLGAAPPAPELGAMTAQSLQYLFTSPWVALAPAFAVLLLTAIANLAGDALRENLHYL